MKEGTESKVGRGGVEKESGEWNKALSEEVMPVGLLGDMDTSRPLKKSWELSSGSVSIGQYCLT